MMRPDDDLSRLDALRALLAAHEPVPDDRRGGHHYIYPDADPKLRKGARATKKARIEWLRRAG